jgi:hypothetical protein
VEHLSNVDIVTIAVYVCGGQSKAIDTEDVAVATAEIAPGRFSWRKYPDQINIEQVRRRLTDAALASKGGFVVGSHKTGWQLTNAGLRFCERTAQSVTGDLARTPMNRAERNWAFREKARLLTSKAYLIYQSEGAAAVSRSEAEAFFKLDEYIHGDARERKISRLLNTFQDDPQLADALVSLAEVARKGGS